ncbi:hypothetical protein [Tahibacter harae]|uniref:Delta-60 repeat protein n=1 Tax=Tahibacter harae TaxID=2963937 RepID=A0ABT1QXR4_9GAMM|nr:hypothetical protein [Tahibacter harae]MCQ4167068.1 hypothetical protein [Tahibacter harae]
MKPFTLSSIALSLGLTAAALGGSAGAHVGPLDPAFGDGGMRNYAFQAVNGGSNDQASVGCAAADGSFTVTGIASGENRLVTLRLKPDGDYDETYGAQGRVSVTLPGSPNDFVPGLCQPDGHMVMARASTAAGEEQNLQILRVLKHTGQLDPQFGSGGIVNLDLDAQVVTALGRQEMPLGVNALPNGDIAVTGQAQLQDSSEYRGFIVLLAANGSLKRARVFTTDISDNATTTVEAPDGRLWVFGQNGRNGGAYRLTLSRTTLEQEDILERPLPFSNSAVVGAGRALDARTVALAGAIRYNVRGNSADRVLLFVFDEDSASVDELEPVTLDGQPVTIDLAPGRQLITVLPGRRVLLSGQIRPYSHMQHSGIYLGMAHVRRDGAIYTENGFGATESSVIAFRPATPPCAGTPPEHRVSRLTLWLGMPVLVGGVTPDCGAEANSEDYLVARMRPDYLFADGW